MNKLRWVTISQSIILFGAALVFPFYIIFIKDIGANFTEFGLAYGIFTISAALVHKIIGKLSDKHGGKLFLIINSWGMAFLFLLFPIVTNIYQVYVLQIVLGIFGAMQKTSEKFVIANLTEKSDRGIRIGSYHWWVSLFSGFAAIVGGYLIDLFTIEIIFYLGAIILFVGGLITLKIKERQ